MLSILVSNCSVYPASKTLMTRRHCSLFISSNSGEQQVYPAPKSPMTLRCCQDFSVPLYLYFLELSYFLEEFHHLLHLTIISQQCPYVTLDTVFCSTVPPLGQCFIVRLLLACCMIWVEFQQKTPEYTIFCIVRLYIHESSPSQTFPNKYASMSH